MREKYIFRAKNFNGNEWAYGDLVHIGTCTYIREASGKHNLIKEKTIGQYTRVWDKNNKRVFAGDVISYKDKRRSTVEKGLVFEDESGFWIKTKAYGYFFDRGLCNCDVISVLGNIFDDEGLKKEFENENS